MRRRQTTDWSSSSSGDESDDGREEGERKRHSQDEDEDELLLSQQKGRRKSLEDLMEEMAAEEAGKTVADTDSELQGNDWLLSESTLLQPRGISPIRRGLDGTDENILPISEEEEVAVEEEKEVKEEVAAAEQHNENVSTPTIPKDLQTAMAQYPLEAAMSGIDFTEVMESWEEGTSGPDGGDELASTSMHKAISQTIIVRHATRRFFASMPLPFTTRASPLSQPFRSTPSPIKTSVDELHKSREQKSAGFGQKSRSFEFAWQRGGNKSGAMARAVSGFANMGQGIFNNFSRATRHQSFEQDVSSGPDTPGGRVGGSLPVSPLAASRTFFGRASPKTFFGSLFLQRSLPPRESSYESPEEEEEAASSEILLFGEMAGSVEEEQLGPASGDSFGKEAFGSAALPTGSLGGEDHHHHREEEIEQEVARAPSQDDASCMMQRLLGVKLEGRVPRSEGDAGVLVSSRRVRFLPAANKLASVNQVQQAGAGRGGDKEKLRERAREFVAKAFSRSGGVEVGGVLHVGSFSTLSVGDWDAYLGEWDAASPYAHSKTWASPASPRMSSPKAYNLTPCPSSRALHLRNSPKNGLWEIGRSGEIGASERVRSGGLMRWASGSERGLSRGLQGTGGSERGRGGEYGGKDAVFGWSSRHAIPFRVGGKKEGGCMRDAEREQALARLEGSQKGIRRRMVVRTKAKRGDAKRQASESRERIEESVEGELAGLLINLSERLVRDTLLAGDKMA